MNKRTWTTVAVGLGLMLTTMAVANVRMRGMARKDARVLAKAPQVLAALTSAPDQGIPEDFLERAECVMVFPSVTKGAFVVGGEHGRGVATCRRSDGTMSPPAFFNIGGGSVGWQVGGKQTDLVLLIMNRGGIDKLIASNFTIGGEASAAVGPVGRTAEAATDAQLNAQILSWSRSQGLFVGASLKGAVIKPNQRANEMTYGPDVTARDILLEGSVSTPAEGVEFVRLVQDLTEKGA